MVDQTTRLEVATVKAEQGSDILHQFANNAAGGPAIPTESGAIPALKDVILDIQQEGADKISFATTIYPSTAAGIAATTNGAIFLVRTADPDEIYAVYQNNSGTAVDTGQRALSASAIAEAMDSATDAAQAAQDAADAALAQTARFIAPRTIDPTARDNGSPLEVGDQYLNTGSTPNQNRVYGTSGWFTPDVDGATLQSQIDALDADKLEAGDILAGSGITKTLNSGDVTLENNSPYPMFGVLWWPNRASIPSGFVLADGQTLPRATYPDAWSAIAASGVPVVADATWLSTASERGKYTAGNGTTTFRVPDYNGKSSGAPGAPFLRGDGALSAAVMGVIQLDAMQGHRHSAQDASFNSGTAGGVNRLANTVNDSGTGSVGGAITDGVNGAPRLASETRPVNVTGVFIIKLFGAATNVGSANAAQLASDYANLSAAFQSSRAGPFANTYLLVEDRKAANTAGGSAVAATWTTRDLNTVAVNRITGASLAANQISLPAGTYRVLASCPANGVGAHVAKLRNITAGVDIAIGKASQSIATAANSQTESTIAGEFTIAATTFVELQHNVVTARATNGFGSPANLGVTEIYSRLELWRLA